MDSIGERLKYAQTKALSRRRVGPVPQYLYLALGRFSDCRRVTV